MSSCERLINDPIIGQCFEESKKSIAYVDSGKLRRDFISLIIDTFNKYNLEEINLDLKKVNFKISVDEDGNVAGFRFSFSASKDFDIGKNTDDKTTGQFELWGHTP